jgi:hypothetical protein
MTSTIAQIKQLTGSNTHRPLPLPRRTGQMALWVALVLVLILSDLLSPLVSLTRPAIFWGLILPYVYFMTYFRYYFSPFGYSSSAFSDYTTAKI